MNINQAGTNPLFHQFQLTYNEAIAEIQSCLDDPSIGQLTHWLLTTDANPYSFLPHAWGESLASAEQFANLLNSIKIAIDANELTIIRVNQEPRIVFYNPTDLGFMDKVLTSTEQSIQRKVQFGYPGTFTIEVLDTDPNRFGEVYDAWFKDWLQQSCVIDAKTHGAEFAKRVYSKYRMFEESWIDNEKA